MFCILRTQLLVKLISNFNTWMRRPPHLQQLQPYLTQFPPHTVPSSHCFSFAHVERTTRDFWPMQTQTRYTGSCFCSTVAVTQNIKWLPNYFTINSPWHHLTERKLYHMGKATAHTLFLQFTHSHLTTCTGSEFTDREETDCCTGGERHIVLLCPDLNQILCWSANSSKVMLKHLESQQQSPEKKIRFFFLNKVSRHFQYHHLQVILFVRDCWGSVSMQPLPLPMALPTVIQRVVMTASFEEYWEMDRSAEHNDNLLT